MPHKTEPRWWDVVAGCRDYLARNRIRRVAIGREWLRQLLRRNEISFQRPRTWKESRDPDKETNSTGSRR